MAEVTDWNPVDDLNNSAPPVGWPEGMVPSTVNNAARAMQGALKREHDRIVAGTQDLPYVKRSGDTMTGNLAINGTGGLALGATQLQNIANGLQVSNAANGSVTSRGPSCGFVFGDYNQTSADWKWYASANIAHLFLNGTGDRLSVDASGNMLTTGTVNATGFGVNGLLALNRDGSGNTQFYDQVGQVSILLASSQTYYKNNTHTWQNDAGTQTAQLDVSGNFVASAAVNAPTVSATNINASNNVTASNAVVAPGYFVGGSLLANRVADALVLYDGIGQQCIYMSPATTYYKNTTHQFQDDSGVNTASINAAGTVTATSFVGNFAGGGGNTVTSGTVNSTTINNSGTATTANLTASSNVTAAGSLTGGSIHSTGTAQIDGRLNALQDAYFGPSGGYARIDGVGTYNISGVWLTFSDRAVKQNVAEYTAGLDAINRLAPVSFTYTNEIEDTQVTRYGLVADDVATVLPEMVGEALTPGGHVRSTLASGHLTFVLLNAVKELSAKVAALEAQLAAAGGV